jgi:hypothetical protein
MKIAFCGTSSVGKTTLAKLVAKKLNLPILTDKDLHREVFTLMAEQGHPVSTEYFPGMTRQEHVDFERHVWLCRQDALRRLGNDWITDESPIDFINWFYIVCGPYPEHMSADEFRFFKNCFLKELPHYDLIVYLPVGVLPVENDNRRFTNSVSLEFWDNAIRGLLFKLSDDLGSRLLIVPRETTDLEARAALVVETVELLVKHCV